MRTVEVELVDYRRDKMAQVSEELVHDFAEYSGLDWVQRSQDVLEAIHGVLEDQKTDQVLWHTPGLTIFFSGMPPVLLRAEHERLVYSATEPYFVLEEIEKDKIEKSKRDHITRVADAVARKMTDIHKMRLSGDPSFRQLTFPKDVYARSIERFQVPVLS